MEKIDSSYDIMNRTLEKKKLLPLTDYITNDFAEILHKRLEQLESHNFKLENDLKHLEINVKLFFITNMYIALSKYINMFQCNKLNNENQAMKLFIEETDKKDVQKSLVEIEVQTQNVYEVL